MTRKQIVATVLQAAGVLSISAGIGYLVLWGGIVTLGIGLVAFGVAIERAES